MIKGGVIQERLNMMKGWGHKGKGKYDKGWGYKGKVKYDEGVGS